MANYKNFIITDAGDALNADALGGKTRIEFTGLSVSDQKYEEDELKELTDLASIQQSTTKLGIEVKEIFAVAAAELIFWIDRLSELSPSTRIYCNQDPSMIYYDPSECEVDITIGRDAGLYHKECPNLAWNSDEQPFGYDGLIRLLDGIDRAISDNELPETVSVKRSAKGG